MLHNISQELIQQLRDHDYTLCDADSDLTRPWGGFLVIPEVYIPRFLEDFFPRLTLEDLHAPYHLKIIIMLPHTLLSWHYHERRREYLSVVYGSMHMMNSPDGTFINTKCHQKGDMIVVDPLEKHRIITDVGFCIIAELWQHTEKGHPSDEDDIIRIWDDYGRVPD